MERRKFTKEEIEQWRKDNNQGWFYFNKNDSNLFVPKRYGFGRTINFAHPVSWVFVIVIIGFIIYKILR